jgi:hypothetical protein
MASEKVRCDNSRKCKGKIGKMKKNERKKKKRKKKNRSGGFGVIRQSEHKDIIKGEQYLIGLAI